MEYFGITRENKNEINLRKMPKMYSSILKSIPSFSLPTVKSQKQLDVVLKCQFFKIFKIRVIF